MIFCFFLLLDFIAWFNRLGCSNYYFVVYLFFYKLNSAMISYWFTRCGDFGLCNSKIWLLTTEFDSNKTKTMHITLNCRCLCFVVVTNNLPFAKEQWPLMSNLSKAKAIKPDNQWKSLYFKSILYFYEELNSECQK